ncbi:MAG: hypothetical protein V1743_08045, partial [Nanoarchaeota archaeon]
PFFFHKTMNPKEIVEKLEASQEFKSFLKQNPDYYLSSIFSFKDGRNEGWKVGYYSPKKDKIVSFSLNPVSHDAPEEVFKDEAIVEKLNLEKVKIDIDNALKICDELHSRKYAMHTCTKRFVVLQNYKQTMYNVTMITDTFNIINIKLDAEDGKVISEFLKPAMAFEQKEKK